MRLSRIVMVAALVAVAATATAQDVTKPMPQTETNQAMKPAAAAANPTVAAKTDAAPLVADMDGLKLDKMLLSVENLQLKLAQGQAELEKLKTEAQTLINGMQKPGFQLARNETGAWVYQAQKPADSAKK